MKAEGEAQAIRLVNEAADKFFVGNAQLLKGLVALEHALSANTKFVIPSNSELVSIIGDMAGVLPLSRLPLAAKRFRPHAATADAPAQSSGGNTDQ